MVVAAHHQQLDSGYTSQSPPFFPILAGMCNGPTWNWPQRYLLENLGHSGPDGMVRYGNKPYSLTTRWGNVRCDGEPLWWQAVTMAIVSSHHTQWN